MGSGSAWKDTFSMDWSTSWGGTKAVATGGEGPIKTKEKAREAEILAANAKAIPDARVAKETASNQASSQINARRQAVARSRSVYTSPLGLNDMATTAKKTLLGA